MGSSKSFSPPLAIRIVQGLSKISMALKTRNWRKASDAHLSPTQGQILSLLHAHGPLRLSALADALAVTSATASDAVASLAAKRLVLKREDKTDPRALAIELSASGRKCAKAASQWPDFLTTAVDSLSPEEQIVFHRGLVKMIRTLQERRQIPVARMCVNCRYFRPGVHAEPATPHHCDYVDAAFGDRELRMDCADFQPSSSDEGWLQWVSLAQLTRTH